MEQEDNSDARKLPMILPFVVYHGTRDWTDLGLQSLIDRPEGLDSALHLLLPQLNYELVDLLNLPQGRLPRRALGLLALTLLKNASLDRDLWRVLFQWGWLLNDAWTEAGERALELLLSYIYRVDQKPDEQELQAFLLDTLPEELKEAAMRVKKTYAQELIEEGLAKGLAKGRAEGRVEGVVLGQRRFLLQFLERRFGPLPQHLTARIEAADGDTLSAWSERLPTAEALDDVFGA